MADSLDFSVDGLAELEAKLIDLGGTGAKRAVRKGLRAGANVSATGVRARAPQRTGNLKRNIVVKDLGEQSYGYAFSVDVNQKAFYGLFDEFGTSKMAAIPFVRPGMQETAIAAFAAMRDATMDALEAEGQS